MCPPLFTVCVRRIRFTKSFVSSHIVREYHRRNGRSYRVTRVDYILHKKKQVKTQLATTQMYFVQADYDQISIGNVVVSVRSESIFFLANCLLLLWLISISGNTFACECSSCSFTHQKCRPVKRKLTHRHTRLIKMQLMQSIHSNGTGRRVEKASRFSFISVYCLLLLTGCLL